MTNKVLMMANLKQSNNDVGKKTSVVGIVGSLLICLIEIVSGLFCNCITLIYDGIHNVLDAVSSLLSLIAFKISDKKPTKEFPNGMGRIQYIMSLIISEFIIVVGVLFINSSFRNLFNQQNTKFILPVFILMLFTLAVKWFLSFYFNNKSIELNSVVLKAVSVDNRNDLFIIGVALLPLIFAYFNIQINIDSICGLVIGVIIVISGIKLLISSSQLLIGKSVSENLINQVKEVILKSDNVQSIIELNLYDFVNCYYGSAKIVVDERLSLDYSSKLAYDIETKLQDWLNVDMVVRVTDNRYKLSIEGR